MRWKTKELRAIKERPRDYEGVEERIRAALEEGLYLPVLHALGLPHGTLSNARDTALERALIDGRLTLEGTTVRGKFSAATSKELRELGAVRVKGGFSFPDTNGVPLHVMRAAVRGVKAAAEQARQVDDALRQLSPAEIAGSIRAAPLFDSTLWNLDRQLKASLQGFGMGAPLSAEDRKRIAREWQGNLELWVTDFTAKEIRRLRDLVQEKALKGARRQDLEKEIRKSFGVSVRKAKFLARQETGLLMAKIKESRYTAAGVTQYKWVCVAGSALHPVRPSHKILEGKIFSWNSPPTTSAPGEPVRRNNPGQDFNCRCYAKPIVSFREPERVE